MCFFKYLFMCDWSVDSLLWKVPPILLDKQFSDFTPDITPIILAAHTNNYEIIKLLVQKGVSMPQPHEVGKAFVFVVLISEIPHLQNVKKCSGNKQITAAFTLYYVGL